jgi:hypothetical protein
MLQESEQPDAVAILAQDLGFTNKWNSLLRQRNFSARSLEKPTARSCLQPVRKTAQLRVSLTAGMDSWLKTALLTILAGGDA